VAKAKLLSPIAVHIRRGDYKLLPEFGLLGKRYYQDAIERLRDEGHQGPVWIFSDDPVCAQKMLQGEAISLGAIGDLYVMSHASANVIANSTFSWWGAWMNESSQNVIAPNPWFQGMAPIQDLIPPDWTCIPAVFE
jgi:hypothetical protein